jgi:hypothetical protein
MDSYAVEKSKIIKDGKDMQSGYNLLDIPV